ncbi:replication protein RepA [Rhodocytophaga aerolata]|uniref:Replication protein RepA n=1 Tax=Rhodocytophaga aerolata TaxID=455078 RepID=A0ABT8RGS8_9BACT|nr:replication protein RepA [Rhodocytophaga aerolata]MDO1451311.1 replication protein RepA [Rhodocytophaga aerolata]
MANQEQQIIKHTYDTIVSQSESTQLLFQHAVLCQVYLPYRDPGKEVDSWVRQQGKAYFAIQATKVFNPQSERYDKLLGLPFGPKARLILTHINTLALLQRSPNLEVSDTITSFVKSLGLPNNGYQIDAIKNQLGRLAASMISIAFSPGENRSFQVDSKIIKGFDLWFPKNPNQRVLWDGNIVLSEDYFFSLMNHAVPLDKRHLAVFANNAMAIDIYTWLAQRLHRVSTQNSEFVHWVGLKEQFGEGYARMDHFKESFRSNLRLVLTQYSNAKIEEDLNKGFILKNSSPPIPPKTHQVLKIDKP